MRTLSISLLVTLSTAIAAERADAQNRRYVDDTATGANTGLTWSDAFTSLQSALAVGGFDELWVAEGTYRPHDGPVLLPADRVKHFAIPPGKKLYGGFPNGGAATLAEANPELYVTTLSGDIGTPAVNTDNTLHVLRIENNFNALTAIDGFRVADGNALPGFGEPNSGKGGGLVVSGAQLTITRCKFEANRASNRGGAMELNTARATIVDCELKSNVATSSGGAIFTSSGSSLVHTKIERCRFVANSASIAGGLFDDIPFLNNIVIRNCDFVSNSAATAGAARSEYYGQFQGCLFSSNSSSAHGGAMALDGAYRGTIIGCTFVKNHCAGNGTGGGAIAVDQFLGNPHAPPYSGDQVSSCIFNGNTCPITGKENFHITSPGAGFRVSYSLVTGGWTGPGVGNINTNPQFVDFANGDYHLSPTSPCIDAGDGLAIPVDYVEDIDGDTRVTDAPNVAGTGNPASFPEVDMGYDEYCPALAASSHSGASKPGINGIPTLTSSGLPYVPTPNFGLSIANGPGTPGVLFVGISTINVPFDQGTLLVDPFFFIPITTDPNGNASYLVPLDAALCGLTLQLQLVFPGDPGAIGYYQTSQSDRLTLTFGG